MPDLEHRLIKRWTAAAYIKAGLAVMALGAAPLLLYTAFGPSDGNPIGLGMLAVVAIPVGFLLAGIGVLRWLVGKAQ